MEARFQIPVAVQRQLSVAANAAAGQRFALPNSVARALVAPAYLGQLDVDPLGRVPGSRNDHRDWQFTGKEIETDDTASIRLQIAGMSKVEGGASEAGRRRDGRQWEHRVTLRWQGYVDLKSGQIVDLTMLAEGTEELHWGNARLRSTTEADIRHLMAGHSIDLECDVLYGMEAAGRRR